MVDDFRVVGSVATAFSEGDWSQEVKVKGENDVMNNGLSTMNRQVTSIVHQVKVAVSEVAAGSEQIAGASQSLSTGATQQAASLEEVGASMSEIGQKAKVNADNSQRANELATAATSAAEKGRRSMEEMESAMNRINDGGVATQKVIKTIDDIAFQTNLLALNAAVEAARAGRHGKGFAVVAEEVRSLAARSAKAAKETADLIDGSIHEIEEGVKVSQQTVEALAEIGGNVSETRALIGDITDASLEQAKAITEINEGLSQIDAVTQANAASAEEAAASSQEMSAQARVLEDMVAWFRVSETSANIEMEESSQPARLNAP